MSNAPDSKLPPVESGTNYYQLTTRGLAYRADLRAKFAERQIKRLWIMFLVHSVAIAFIGFCLLATQLFPREPAKPQSPSETELQESSSQDGESICPPVSGDDNRLSICSRKQTDDKRHRKWNNCRHVPQLSGVYALALLRITPPVFQNLHHRYHISVDVGAKRSALVEKKLEFLERVDYSFFNLSHLGVGVAFVESLYSTPFGRGVFPVYRPVKGAQTLTTN